MNFHIVILAGGYVVGESLQAAALLGSTLASHISLCPLTQLRASSLAARNCSGPNLSVVQVIGWLLPGVSLVASR
jgi:hypothetical protein